MSIPNEINDINIIQHELEDVKSKSINDKTRIAMIDFGMSRKFVFTQDKIEYIGQIVLHGARHISFGLQIYVKNSSRNRHNEKEYRWFGCPDEFINFLYHSTAEYIPGENTYRMIFQRQFEEHFQSASSKTKLQNKLYQTLFNQSPWCTYPCHFARKECSFTKLHCDK